VTLNVCVAIVSMPVRAVPVFAATLKPTTPLPVPAAPDVTVSHTALLTAVHAHAAVVVTFTVPVFAVEGTFCAVGAIAYVHAAGGGAAPAACDTENVRFAIEIAPVRAAPVFAATANVTTPFPRPVGPDVTVIHGASLATAQSQVLCDCTEMDPGPPAAGTFWPVGEIVVLQFGGAAAD